MMRKCAVLFLTFICAAAFVRGQGGGVLSSSAPQIKEEAKPVAAYLDIDYVFRNHPWTSNTKEALQLQLRAKAVEIEGFKKEIDFLREETAVLEDFLQELQPFYETQYWGGLQVLPLGARAKEEEELDFFVRRITFGGADIRFNSPLDSNMLLAQTQENIKNNLNTINERELAIEKQRLETRDKIKQEEQVEVQEILADIYEELKIYAMKRNIALIVNKKSILYGAQPVDITADFADRLKKTKKERKGKKGKRPAVVLELDKEKAPKI